MTKLVPLSMKKIREVSRLVGLQRRLVCELNDDAGDTVSRITLKDTCRRLLLHPWYPVLCLIFHRTEGRPYPCLRTILFSESKRGEWLVTGIRVEEGQPVLTVQRIR